MYLDLTINIDNSSTTFRQDSYNKILTGIFFFGQILLLTSNSFWQTGQERNSDHCGAWTGIVTLLLCVWCVLLCVCVKGIQCVLCAKGKGCYS